MVAGDGNGNGFGLMNIVSELLDAEMILSIVAAAAGAADAAVVLFFLGDFCCCLFICGFCVFVHYTCVCLSLKKRKLVYPQAWSRRWKRFIRRYQSSFHSMTIERGPIPTVPEGLSMSLPKIKYDLREMGEWKRERDTRWEIEKEEVR